MFMTSGPFSILYIFFLLRPPVLRERGLVLIKPNALGPVQQVDHWQAKTLTSALRPNIFGVNPNNPATMSMVAHRLVLFDPITENPYFRGLWKGRFSVSDNLVTCRITGSGRHDSDPTEDITMKFSGRQILLKTLQRSFQDVSLLGKRIFKVG